MKMLSFIKEWTIYVIVAVFMIYSFPNQSSYFEVDNINAPVSISINEVIPLQINRFIHKEFDGSFTVNVKQFTDSGPVSYCSGSGNLHYKPSAVLPSSGKNPNELNLGWWIGVSSSLDCSKGYISEIGTYIIESCWTIERPFTFPITLCKDSNTFKIEDA